jgi:hypothetical protein
MNKEIRRKIKKLKIKNGKAISEILKQLTAVYGGHQRE